MRLHCTKQDLARAGGLALNANLSQVALVWAQFETAMGKLADAAEPSKLETQLEFGTREATRTGERLAVELKFGMCAEDGAGKERIAMRTVWRLEYDIHPDMIAQEPPDQDAVQAFAKTSAVMNAWPFWREYAHSMTQRAGLPRFTLPLLTLTTVPEPESEGDVKESGGKKARAAKSRQARRPATR